MRSHGLAWSGLDWRQLWDRRRDAFTVQELINSGKGLHEHLRASAFSHSDSTYCETRGRLVKFADELLASCVSRSTLGVI